MSPYEAVFGQKERMSLTASLPREFLMKITSGEEEFDELLSTSSNEDDPDGECENNGLPNEVSE